MTIHELLNELKKQHAELESVIGIVESYTKSSENKATREKINKYVRKKKHWTQTPEGKKKLSRMSKKAWKNRRGE